jgi:FMN phosphatase YigB (HAD superfamily)
LSQDKYNKLIIISKAFPNNARKSKELLKIHGIDDYFNSIIFCERREDKAKIAEAMRVNIMIDDTEEVLSYFPDTIRTVLYKHGETFEI